MEWPFINKVILSYPILSHPIPSHPILSYPIQSLSANENINKVSKLNLFSIIPLVQLVQCGLTIDGNSVQNHEEIVVCLLSKKKILELVISCCCLAKDGEQKLFNLKRLSSLLP